MKNFQTAIFAGGCFWCTEKDFSEIEGVISVTSGYTAGQTKNPTYEEVCTGKTGHYEAVKIVFDPDITGYKKLVEIFIRSIDPTNAEGQFCDLGSQYQTAIFYNSKEQQEIARQVIEEIDNSGILQEKIVTKILPAEEFYEAEEYHQKYYDKNNIRYNAYRIGSGRDRQLNRIWGKTDNN